MPLDAMTRSALEDSLQSAMGMDRPLGEQLAAMTAAFRHLRPATASAYDALVARLDAAKAGSAGPSIGEPMPPFVLPDQDGRLTSLAELIESGPLVVSFNRGHWCAYCRLEARALAKAKRQMAALGAGLVSITPERSQFTSSFRRAESLDFAVLSDVGLGYALAAGLAIWIGKEVGSLYREAGIDLNLYHGSGGSLLPIPATFVVGKDGLIKDRFVDPDFRRRMAVEDLLETLVALRG